MDDNFTQNLLNEAWDRIDLVGSNSISVKQLVRLFEELEKFSRVCILDQESLKVLQSFISKNPDLRIEKADLSYFVKLLFDQSIGEMFAHYRDSTGDGESLLFGREPTESSFKSENLKNALLKMKAQSLSQDNDLEYLNSVADNLVHEREKLDHRYKQKNLESRETIAALDQRNKYIDFLEDQQSELQEKLDHRKSNHDGIYSGIFENYENVHRLYKQELESLRNDFEWLKQKVQEERALRAKYQEQMDKMATLHSLTKQQEAYIREMSQILQSKNLVSKQPLNRFPFKRVIFCILSIIYLVILLKGTSSMDEKEYTFSSWDWLEKRKWDIHDWLED